MTFVFAILSIVLGIALLVFGADWLVAGATIIARRLKISPLVIGLTVVAFGTSLPEFAVNVSSAFQGRGDVAIGNILGSNIANILLILGVSSLLFPLAVKRSTALKEIPIAAGAVLVLLLGVQDGVLGIFDGALLLCLGILFLWYAYKIGSIDSDEVIENGRIFQGSLIKEGAKILSGLVLLLVGGMVTVDGAVAIAELFGASERVIALTIVAVGTSFPELFTSVVAAYRKQADIAIGNVVGSNILNVLIILGATALVRPLSFSNIYATDAILVLFATSVLFLSLFIGKRYLLERWQGALFVVFYVGYLVWLVQAVL